MKNLLGQQFQKSSPGIPTDSQDPFKGPTGQNHFHNNTKMPFALFALILSQVDSGIFQRLCDL